MGKNSISGKIINKVRKIDEKTVHIELKNGSVLKLRALVDYYNESYIDIKRVSREILDYDYDS